MPAPVQRKTALKASPALHAALDIIAEKLDDHGKVVGYEFERLRSISDADWVALEQSTAAANPQLNRYVNVLPFDQNRVKLNHGTNDYINASLLSSRPGSQVAWTYIATQGPLKHTAAQFWQMVLEQKVVVIVMLTHVIEKQAEKCAQYFPLKLNEEAVFGLPGQVIKVKTTAVQDLDRDICMRHFSVANSSAAAPHVVTHYYYHRYLYLLCAALPIFVVCTQKLTMRCPCIACFSQTNWQLVAICSVLSDVCTSATSCGLHDVAPARAQCTFVTVTYCPQLERQHCRSKLDACVLLCSCCWYLASSNDASLTHCHMCC